MTLTPLNTHLKRVLGVVTVFASILTYAGFFVSEVYAEVEPVSQTKEGEWGIGNSNKASISSDGRYVVFHSSSSNLISGRVKSQVNGYLKDRQTGITTIFNKTSQGEFSNRSIFDPMISDNGEYIVFTSHSNNLTLNDRTESFENRIYRYTRKTQEFELVNSNINGQWIPGPISISDISADGSHILYSRLGLSNNPQIYHKNMESGEVKVVSADVNNNLANQEGVWGDISADGKYATFRTRATNLSSSSDDSWKIYRKDLLSGNLQEISIIGLGNKNSLASRPYLTDEGRYILFSAKNIRYKNSLIKDSYIYRVDTQTQIMDQYSQSSDSTLSVSGDYIVFESIFDVAQRGSSFGRLMVYVQNMNTKEVRLVSELPNGEYTNTPSIEGDIAGDHIVFSSSEMNWQEGNLAPRRKSQVLYRKKPFLDEDPEDPSDYPIILVHGILGSLNSKMLFPLEQAPFVDGGSAILKGFNIIPDSISSETWYQFPQLDVTWDGIISPLNQQGYIEGEDFFRFSYDWRQPNQKSAYDLKSYIDQVKQRTNSEKVNIVAHSMGGLVTRAYIEDMANNSVSYEKNNTIENISDRIPYEEDIHSFVMAGTPNEGSAESIPKWYGGDVFSGSDPVKALGMQILLGLKKAPGLNTFYNTDILQKEFVATRDLLPTYENSMKGWTGLNPFNRISFWFPRIQDNTFLNELNQKSQSNTSNLAQVNTLSIAGIGQNTVESVEFVEQSIIPSSWNPFHPRWTIRFNNDIFWFDKLELSEQGDGTVLKRSGLNSLVDTQEIQVNIDPNIITNDYRHGSIYNFSETINETLSFINIPYIENTQENSNIFSNFSHILINMYSPADISVTLPNGEEVSSSLSEKEFQDKDVLYISQGIEDHKVLVVPHTEDGEYSINVEGTGEGDYTLGVTYLGETERIESYVEGDIITGEQEEYTFDITTNEDGALENEELEISIKNTPPEAALNQTLYETVAGETLTFDATNSSDLDGDTLQYRFIIEGLVDTGFTYEAVLNYAFSEAYSGKIALTVTDGELESTVEAIIIIEEKPPEESLDTLQELLNSLEEDTSYIRSRKRVWLQLTNLLESPVIQRLPRLKKHIIQILERDIQRSLLLNERLQRGWWWRRRILINESNVQILQEGQKHINNL